MTFTKNRIKLIAFALFLSLCILVANLPGIKGRITIEAVNSHLDQLTQFANQPWGPVLFVVISAAIILFHMPGLIPVIAAGLFYDLWSGFLYSWIATVIGTTLTFVIARFLLRDYFQPKLERSFIQPFLGKLETNGVLTMIVLRIFMVMMPPLNWFLGASKVTNRDYILGNILGLAPVCFAVVLGVKRLRHVRSLWDLLQPETVAVVGIFFLVLGVIIYFRYRIAKSASAPKADSQQ